MGCIYERSGKPQEDLIDSRWIQSFCIIFTIVSRSQTGKLQLSPEKTFSLENYFVRHLSRLKRVLKFGDLYELCIRNAYETHFIFNIDNRRTLAYASDEEVR